MQGNRPKGNRARGWLAALFALAACGAQAATWPAQQPIRLIVPAAPGGSLDILSRPLATQLGAVLGQTVIVENRGGAGGMLGADYAAKATPDGYTFLMGAVHHAIGATVNHNLMFKPERDLVAVASIGTTPNVVIVNKKLPVNTPQELVAWMKQKGDSANYATGGPGTLQHLSMEWFKSVAGVKAVAVHYRGSAPAMSDLLGGQVDLMFETMPLALAQTRSGAVRAIAVTSQARAPALPALPTLGETVAPGFAVSSWYGVMAPAGTPPAIMDRMHDAIERALETPELKKVWDGAGVQPDPMSRAQFQAFWLDDIQRWGKIAREHAIRID
ncbi:Bug family tripartite tricarboxylate transporter substrate binding protein [Bordetella hinzii]|uniref:Tripartite tricarboxylate transporter substrate binding protein n=2 Tax=Bordetella hinzii TaxID=103855 RepID=A0AAN1RYC0_9BORD|nr:tripartite tricarboxylate transporter substrate binding protein [Bordetella hinzii]AKQ61491.1 Tripartite tricarboxylate transporter family receptor [Bordetella hinzii]AZW17542.1 tripartite tricarboxylate transporter substrate binding protein [Bordetella hinzii]KCB23910.1 tripartite tricarboxylate transporter family receptor [Bordetella hinzii OH87 BAL007II]KCB42389.1 tripartite tricarboxylate transporter family receptor [Bordetella hinzii 5132]KCB46598.1 tripartite tricarboxylate transporte